MSDAIAALVAILGAFFVALLWLLLYGAIIAFVVWVVVMVLKATGVLAVLALPTLL